MSHGQGPRTQDTLRLALHRAAENVSPDTGEMWNALNRRTLLPRTDPTHTSATTPSRATLWGTPTTIAAVIGLVIGGITLLAGPNPRPNDTVRPNTGPVRGPVGPAWVCPHQTRYGPDDASFSGDVPEGNTKGAFYNVHPLDTSRVNEPSFEATVFGVDRYDFESSGTRGRLKYGTRDGLMQSVTHLIRDDGSWRATGRTLCSGPDGSSTPRTTDPLMLTARRTVSSVVPRVRDLLAVDDAREVAGSPVLIDAREYFEQTGELRVQFLHAVPITNCLPAGTDCVLEVQLSGPGDHMASVSQGASALYAGTLSCGAIVDVSYSPADDDGRLICAAYEANGDPAAAYLETNAGERVAMTRFRAEDWSGAYFAAVVPEAPAAAIVTMADGGTKRIPIA